MAKTYCTCKKNDYICRGLHDEPLTFRMEELWVHAECCLPFRGIWEAHLRPCEGCLKDSCLPWEVMCQTCHKVEYPGTPYNGLLAVAKRSRLALKWPVDRKLKIEFEEVAPKKRLNLTI